MQIRQVTRLVFLLAILALKFNCAINVGSLEHFISIIKGRAKLHFWVVEKEKQNWIFAWLKPELANFKCGLNIGGLQHLVISITF